MTTVAIGMKLKSGPYGGGNQFGHALTAALQQQGITVVHSLNQPGIDLILVTEVRPWLDICAFSLLEATRYRAHYGTPILLRVNECDERKETKVKLLNEAIRAGARLADHAIYISAWLRDVVTESDYELTRSSSVIYNGADENIFNPQGSVAWDGTSPLKIVTHHWSSHPLKGWDVYQQLDSLIGGELRNQAGFTYIGNLPRSASLRHSRHIPPLTGAALAHELKQHHVYLTASINEPAGMHHIEGGACGLPLLYRSSGALPEYCAGLGIAFEGPEDFPITLKQMLRQYHTLQPRLNSYPHTAAKMTREYTDLFHSLTAHKKPRPSRQLREELIFSARLAALRIADQARYTIASR
jgi:hypothetical protein